MYCSCCGKDCVIPKGMTGIPGLGCITHNRTHSTKVIRCVECTNKYGLGDPTQMYVCVSKKEGDVDPTRMPPKGEFKTGVLQIVTDMLGTIGEPDMMAKDKYELLTNDVTKLFDLCMER